MALLDLLIPDSCASCGMTTDVVCARCVRRLRESIVEQFVPDVDERIAYSASHTSVARKVMLRAKACGDARLVRLLARLLGHAVNALIREADVDPRQSAILVPARSGAATRSRVFGDFAGLLAQAWVRESTNDLLTVQPLLHQRMFTGTQKGLSRVARQSQAGHRWLIDQSPPARASPVIVVDDVVTTGATLASACAVLRSRGWPVIGAAAVTYRVNPAAG